MLQINPQLKKTFWVILIVVFGMAQPVAAEAGLWEMLSEPKNAVLSLLSWVVYILGVQLYGTLATLATKLLVYVAQLNNFTDLPVIIEAWSVVRDIANMFFIVILLVIAFGTLFRIEAYSWKKLLPKMILAAILVNYSRAITGFIVDASQVVMLTFVAAIKDAAVVGIVEAFQLDKLLGFESKMDSETGKKIQSTSQRLIALVAASAMLATLFLVQMIYVVVLVGRLVMIWFLTVLSPLAYAASVLPQTEKFSHQWWEMFTKYVIVGPLCMFFLWLGMFVAAKSVDSGGLGSVAATEAARQVQLGDAKAGGAGALDATLISGFLIASMMLMAGMKMAQENASELSGAISKVSGISKFALKAAPLAAGVVGAVGAKSAIDRLYAGTGLDLNVKRQWGKIQHKREDIKRRREAQGYTKAFAAAQRGNALKAWLGSADFAYEQYLPVLGKQGLWGKHGQRGMLNRWIGNKNFQRENKEVKVMEDDAKTVKTTLTKSREDLREKYTTVEDRDRKLKLNEAAQQTVRDDVSTDGKGWDMTAGTETATLAKTTLDNLQAERSKTTDPVQASRLTAQIQSLQEAMGKGGVVDIELKGNLGTRLSTARTDRLKQLADNRNELRAKETTDKSGNAISTQDQLDAFIKAETAAQQAALDGINAKIKTKKERLAEQYAPVVDYEASQATEEALALERKKYAGEENEDVLKELLKGKILHEKDGVAALGVIQQAASVGHLNEMMDAMGLSENFEGMQKLATMIQKETGVDEQMVLAAFDQASKSAKHINHWTFAEAVTQRNGTYQWRDEDEHLERRYVEMSKVGMNEISRKGNRLAYGGYRYDKATKTQTWEPDPAAMALLVQQLPASVDTAKKGMLNNSAGEHFFTKYGGRYGKELEAMVDATFGAASAEASQAKEALKYWRQATSAKNRTDGDMYGIAKKVAEESRKKAA